MKRLIWIIALLFVAIGASVTPSLSAADPCYEHDCHNGLECFVIGCLNGCSPLGKCEPSAH